jgi:hypothetical protein
MGIKNGSKVREEVLCFEIDEVYVSFREQGPPPRALRLDEVYVSFREQGPPR